jgi:hypothetical protein
MKWTEEEFMRQRWSFINALLVFFNEKSKRQSNGKQ